MSVLGDLLKLLVPGGHKKLLGCGLHGGISTEADTIDRGAGMQGYCRCCYVDMSWYRLFPPLVTACSPISYTRCLPPPLRCLWETLSVIHFLTIYSVFFSFPEGASKFIGISIDWTWPVCFFINLSCRMHINLN